MPKCSGCERAAVAVAEVPACESCQRVVMALVATLKPGALQEPVASELSETRKLTLLKMQTMARELADATLAFADSGLADEELARYLPTIEGMWKALNSTGEKPLSGLAALRH